jgi:Tfp pilus assembly protein PilP
MKGEMKALYLALLLTLASAQRVEAQEPKPAASPVAEQPPPAGTAPPAPQPGHAYDPAGRRDPFISLLGRGNDPGQAAARVPGLPGLLVSEATVRGILRDPNGYIAMVQAPDNKTYIVRAGDKLMDGAVKNITQDTVIFWQDVTDPLSLVKQREVPKRVRAGDGRG